MKIISVVGARPNFMKIAPFIREIERHNKSGNGPQIKHLLVHTGQHYDKEMSGLFFKVLGIPEPDINLSVGSGTHAEQVGQTMIAFEKVLLKEKPDWVVVVGDVNATLACSVTAKKQLVKCCHIEAGLRSGDMTMPEEINRLVTDRLCDLLLIPDEISGKNLKNEGCSDKNIVFVGNIMIDTLETNRLNATTLKIEDIIQKNRYSVSGIRYPVSGDKYAVLTMHRPSNVDKKEVLEPIINFLVDEVAKDLPLIWPIHPRTEKQLKQFSLWEKVTRTKNIILLYPINYLEMLRLNMDAKIMLTDSGGLQEECTILGTPCLTLRWNTERPITLRQHGGVSVLVGNNIEQISVEYQKTLLMKREPKRPPLWDGETAKRCLIAILTYDRTRTAY